MRRLFLCALAALLLVCSSAFADDFANLNAQWRNANGIHVYDMSEPAFQPYVQRAVALWDQSPYVNIDYQLADSCPAKTKAAICVVSPEQCAAFAVIRVKGTTIQSPVLVDLSGSGGICATAAIPGWYASTACHEIGHALGLGHSTDPNSCMALTTVNGEYLNLSPGPGDYEMLQSFYG